MKTAKLVIGIISMVLFVLVAFQSCAAGLRSARSATTVFVRGAATLKALSRHSLICQNRKPATSSTPRFSATKRRSF